MAEENTAPVKLQNIDDKVYVLGTNSFFELVTDHPAVAYEALYCVAAHARANADEGCADFDHDALDDEWGSKLVDAYRIIADYLVGSAEDILKHRGQEVIDQFPHPYKQKWAEREKEV